METITPVIKRKNIDLPVDVLQKLAVAAIGKGLSLKKYIEFIILREASSIKIEVKESPSPSGDPWFDDPENMAIVREGIRQDRAGMGRVMTQKEISEALGL